MLKLTAESIFKPHLPSHSLGFFALLRMTFPLLRTTKNGRFCNRPFLIF